MVEPAKLEYAAKDFAPGNLSDGNVRADKLYKSAQHRKRIRPQLGRGRGPFFKYLLEYLGGLLAPTPGGYYAHRALNTLVGHLSSDSGTSALSAQLKVGPLLDPSPAAGFSQQGRST
jgi:hypothetical protein